MRRLTTIAFAAAALAAAAPTAQADPVAHIACTQAKIQGQSKCIARGQFCVHSSRAERDYKKYGLSCSKRDRNGRYHLQ